jgi:predicted methyltransferase
VLKQKPYPGAAEILREIAQNYDQTEIAYVSDRNEQQTAALREWLEQEGFLFSGDEYVAATRDKREWMKERATGYCNR